MATYTIIPRSDGAGVDILIVSRSGARQTMLGFKTEAEAEAWIRQDTRLNGNTEDAQGGV